jgi:hypothetical protein
LNSNEIDLNEDLLEICLRLSCPSTKFIKYTRPLCIRLRDLVKNRVIDAKFSMSFDSYVEFNYILTNCDKGFRRIIESYEKKDIKKILSHSITRMRRNNKTLDNLKFERDEKKKLTKIISVSPRKIFKETTNIPNLDLEVSNTRVSISKNNMMIYSNESQGIAEQHTIEINLTSKIENKQENLIEEKSSGETSDEENNEKSEDESLEYQSPEKYDAQKFLNLKDSPDYSPSSSMSKTSICSSLAHSPIILRQLPKSDGHHPVIDAFTCDVNVTPPKTLKSYKTFVHSEPNLNKTNHPNLTLDDDDTLIEAQLTHIQPNYEKKLGENFCEGFFISGLPLSDPKVINESVNYTSPCGHEECSLMYGYKPEVIYRLPRRDFKNFELNNTVKFLLFNFVGRFPMLSYGY